MVNANIHPCCGGPALPTKNGGHRLTCSEHPARQLIERRREAENAQDLDGLVVEIGRGLKVLHDEAGKPLSREHALAATKLQEALFWISEAQKR